MSIFDKILRIGEGRALKKLEQLADQIEALEEDFKALSEEQLRGKTAEFKGRLEAGETLDDLLVEAFATVREASARVLGMRPFRVQLIGGAALHQGNIAEMKTGEGKTLVATLPSYLRALTGDGVHVVTVNDYLASYQSDIMGRVYRYLGLTCGCILAGQTPDQRRKQYNCDITYGTNNEFGFDYLRDNMAQVPEEMVQRGHNFVIVDEVDSILIDEARTPLIISGPATGDVNAWYSTFSLLVLKMKAGTDYEVDEKKRTVGVLEPGIEFIEDQLGIENLYDAAYTPLIGFLNNALKAKELFKRDRDYIVADGEVLIVDEHTGRVLPGRRYNEGMHQAIEAKENVKIQAENQTLATITLQNYFRLYPEGSRSGMTGTAETEAAEFVSTYKIGVIPIPTNRPMIRKDQPDLIFPTFEGKMRAVIEDIVERHRKGQPVLVGTTSVEKSELVSRMLKERGVPHEVLNAKQHKREAAVVAMAGRKGAVTVATNMAGRGTDIMLGGNPEHLAVAEMASKGLDPKEDSEAYEAEWPLALERARNAVAAEHDEVLELGGLYVLGTERHESRRIDNQLRGRSGRQGDPGESRFYLSMEDDLMRLFNSGLAQRIMASGAYPEDLPIESKMVSKSIASAQAQVEGRNFEIRKNVLKYDDVMTGQRETIYGERQRVLNGENMEPQMKRFMEIIIANVVNQSFNSETNELDYEALSEALRSVYPASITPQQIMDAAGGERVVSAEDFIFEYTEDIKAEYERLEERLNQNPLALAQLGKEPMRVLERRVVLATVDRLWREHLYEMDYLKEGIGLRAMGQRDPLVEYGEEGAQMFSAMMENIREDSVTQAFSFAGQFELAYQQQQEAALQAAKEEAVKKNLAAPNAADIMGDTGKEHLGKLTTSGPAETAEEPRGNRQERRKKK
ncbi:preprotein translocase, SecA subunit [Gleimia coleocanis DSM 15436]|uniref:Protein translocase subunit SecA n=1 Tax=Gleimia coleocanis DSM 15436 TaxID=525245 RepID=C0VZW3_9ACTO|nr:preprotein translocase subunit SecA [Gleimia coleocanis]EEH63822.1 preprotein translocase, SecA subunit [Gleimia coleocanis DSM 15436]